MIPVKLDTHVFLEDYIPLVGADEVNSIRQKAEKLRGKSVTQVNSATFGNGVAEELRDIVTLMNAVGLKAQWNVMQGTPEFFNVTKKIHNELQGTNVSLTDKEKEIYIHYNKENSFSSVLDADFVVVHGNQPAAMIQFRTERTNKWIWRCHVDMSTPKLTVLNFLQTYISQYDATIFTSEKYTLPSLNLPKTVISTPTINPLSDKNREITETHVREILGSFGVNSERPILTQVARFDQWKDPLGVLDVFNMVRRKVDCQLVLLGSFATDDPEGQKILQKVQEKAKKSMYEDDIKVLIMENNFLVNCLQRASSVVIQKSLKEGFGLTVSEALYKGTPVVASNVGGIPTQVIDGYTGFLHDPKDYLGFSSSILRLLKDPDLRRKIGENGHEHVRKNFLITRLISDWLTLFENILLKK